MEDMKIIHDTAQTIGTTSTSGGGARPMRLADGGGQVMMTLLSNVYSNPYEAVVREYVANGIDSHRQAGVTLPVEVTSPTTMSPQLVVRDYGVGLSVEEMESVYAEYLASTKRDDDGQIGGFGIGAKAGFAVTPAFTVTSVKDGLRSVVVFALDGSSTPTVNALSCEQPTEAASGVTVTIGTDPMESSKWEKGIAQAVRGFDAGAVTVDDEPPARFDEDQLGGEWVGEGGHKVFAYTARNGIYGGHVVMSGICYAVPTDIMSEIRAEFGLSYAASYLPVPDGSLDLAPSRESVRDTPRTRRNIKAAWRAVVDSITTQVRSAYAAADGNLVGQTRARSLATTRIGDLWRHCGIPGDPVLALRPVRLQERRDADRDADPADRRTVRTPAMTARGSWTTRNLHVGTNWPKLLTVVTGVPEDRKVWADSRARSWLLANPDRWLVFAGPDGLIQGEVPWEGSGIPTLPFDEYRATIAAADSDRTPTGTRRGSSPRTSARTYATSEGDLTGEQIVAVGKPVVIDTHPSSLHDKITDRFLLVRHTRTLPKAVRGMEADPTAVNDALFQVAYADLDTLGRLAYDLGIGSWPDTYIRVARALLDETGEATDPALVKILTQVLLLEGMGNPALVAARKVSQLTSANPGKVESLAAWPTVAPLFRAPSNIRWLTPSVASALLAPCRVGR